VKTRRAKAAKKPPPGARKKNSLVLAAIGDVATPPEPPAKNFDFVLGELRDSDIRIAQVERVYSKRGNFQEQGLAPHVRQDPRMARAFKKVPFDVVSVGSNHIGDWGPEGAEDSVAAFQKLGIKTVGAGRDIRAARKPAFIRRNGVTVAFLGYVSVVLPQYWATESRAGAAPMRAHTYYEPYEYQPGAPPRVISVPHEADLEALCGDVAKAKKKADAVVVSLHWGVHYIAKPVADYQPIVAHAAIDAGASLILGTHPHVLQAAEVYKGAFIFYSLGNFSFFRRPGSPNFMCPMGEFEFKDLYDQDVDPGQYFYYRRHGLEGWMAHIDIDKRGVKGVTLIPAYMDDLGRARRLVAGQPEFEQARRFVEWVSDSIPGGVRKVAVDGDRFVLYRRPTA